MNIQPIPSAASKAEEMQALIKVAKLFQPGTYLHDLFTERLIDWVAEQLKNDFPPDVMDVLADRLERLNRSESNAVQLGNELESVKKVTARNIERLDRDHADTIQRMEVRLEQTSTNCQYFQDLAGTNWEQVQSLSNELHHTVTRLNEAEAEIVNLKVKLYDLMNK